MVFHNPLSLTKPIADKADMKPFRYISKIPMIRSYTLALLTGVLVSLFARYNVHSTGPATFLALVTIVMAIDEASERRKTRRLDK